MRVKLTTIILLNLGLVFLISTSALAEDVYDPLSMPGQIKGTGTFFEITDSEYLNIYLQSSEEITVRLESAPKTISLHIESSSANSTTLTIGNLEPNETYYKYEDSYKNEVEFITDENGAYTFTQDLTQSHHIWVQLDKGTVFIPEDCSSYGIWDESSLSCTLTQDLFESAEITENNITLDCNGHSITGYGMESAYGINIFGKKTTVVRNCSVINFRIGISIDAASSNNIIIENSILGNYEGIFMDTGFNNTIIKNNISNNHIAINLVRGSDNNIENNIISNNNKGIGIDHSINNNIIIGNTIQDSHYGIEVLVSDYTKVYHNNFINNLFQAYVLGGVDNFFDNGYPDGGNYWSDYDTPEEECVDGNSDGFCDAPYTFYGGEDGYPFIKEIVWEEIPEKWSFAIITDLHVGQPPKVSDYGTLGWDDDDSGEKDIKSTKNLKNIINLINFNKKLYNTSFVVVTGDFTDSAELSELNKAKEILDTLEIPWIPIIGNHDILPYTLFSSAPEVIEPGDAGADKFFNEIFSFKYQELAGTLENWKKAETPIWNSETSPNHNSYFQNFAFDFNGYHFIGLDFNYRDDAIWGRGVKPEGELYNFSSSSWDWFISHLQQYVNEYPEDNKNIILFSHHSFRKWKDKLIGMGFSSEEMETLCEFFKNYKNRIWGEFAGHSHITKDYSACDDIMQLIETGANVDNPLARIVQIYPDGKIDYSKTLGYGITAVAHSPVDLEIIDPDGLRINKQINEIFGAEYSEEDLDGDGDLDDTIEIPERKIGDYQIRVIPEIDTAPEDTYTLEVSVLEDSYGYVPILLVEDSPISEIPAEPYLVESKERETTQITYTGEINGEYSDQINLSAVLNDIDGNPLANETVNFEIGEQSISAITNESGIASAALSLNQIPGKYYLVEASFAGGEDYLPSTDSEYFEILKENTTIDVIEKEGFAFDEVTLEAEVKDDDGQVLLPEAEVEFRIDSKTLGVVKVDEEGIATISWQVDLIPKEITENYLIEVIFAGNDYYQPAQGVTNFVLKGAKWLKQDTVLELEKTKTGNKKFDKEIDRIILFINQSLDENLWIDASHLVFFEKGKCENLNLERILDKDELDLDNISLKCLKSGIAVFYYERMAVKSVMSKPVFEPIIRKLVKADKLLAQVSLFDAKNTLTQNPKLQKFIENQIKKAEEEIQKGENELQKNKPDKAITRFGKSWLHSQLAIKLANL